MVNECGRNATTTRGLTNFRPFVYFDSSEVSLSSCSPMQCNSAYRSCNIYVRYVKYFQVTYKIFHVGTGEENIW